MQSFDQSLKFLLQHDPADLIGFALDDPTVRILGAVPSVLPARGRDVDGAYLIARGDRSQDAAEEPLLAHTEMHRRHQSAQEIGVDIAEAQVRLFRRERKLVVSHLWDLCGDPDAPVRAEKRLAFGADGSACVYQRINLRGLGWEQLLAQAPAALWALVALTRDGAAQPAVTAVRDAIDEHPAWTQAQRSDHLAVLSFVAEAEGVPTNLMRAVLSKERLMESELYREIYGDGVTAGEARGKAEGEARGKAEGKAESILAVLVARDIPVSDAIRARVLGCTDVPTLDAWIRRAAVASTAAAVVRAKPPAPASARPARATR
jgi:hypothetical protein